MVPETYGEIHVIVSRSRISISLKHFSPSYPPNIYNFLPTLVKNTLIKIKYRLIKNSLLDQIKLIEDEGILVNYKDINQIILALKK